MKEVLNREYFGVKAWLYFIPLFVAIIFLLIGSFNDLDISRAVLNQNSALGIFFEGAGVMIPGFVLTSGGAMLCGALYQRHEKKLTIFGFVLLVLCLIATTIFCGSYIGDDYGYGPYLGGGNKAIRYLLAFGIAFIFQSLAAFLLFFFVFRKTDPEATLRLGIIILAYAAVEAMLVELLKNCCYRPRFRYLAGYTYDTNGDYVLAPSGRINFFRAWYEDWQWFSKAKYVGTDYPLLLNTVSDAVKSFPSGHTAFSGLIMFVPMALPLFGASKEKCKIWQPAAFALAFALWLFIAFARIRVGAHFLSDVSFAMVLGSTLVFVCTEATISIENKIKAKKKIDG